MHSGRLTAGSEVRVGYADIPTVQGVRCGSAGDSRASGRLVGHRAGFADRRNPPLRAPTVRCCCWRPQFAGSGELFRAARAPVTGENLVNGLLRHQLASNHYVFDMRNVADINQWI